MLDISSYLIKCLIMTRTTLAIAGGKSQQFTILNIDTIFNFYKPKPPLSKFVDSFWLYEGQPVRKTERILSDRNARTRNQSAAQRATVLRRRTSSKLLPLFRCSRFRRAWARLRACGRSLYHRGSLQTGRRFSVSRTPGRRSSRHSRRSGNTLGTVVRSAAGAPL